MKRKAPNWIETRESLLARLKNLEDRDSWEEFFNTYWKLIYRVSLKSGLSEEAAEEVVQETFIRVATSIQDFQYDRKIGSFKGWLLQTAQWRINDQFRRQNRQKHRLARPLRGKALEERIADPNGFELEQHWETMWRDNLLEAAVERVKHKVNPTSFQMFDFTVNRGWPAKKVATKMKVSLARVYYAKNNVAHKIRAELKQLEKLETLRQ